MSLSVLLPLQVRFIKVASFDVMLQLQPKLIRQVWQRKGVDSFCNVQNICKLTNSLVTYTPSVSRKKFGLLTRCWVLKSHRSLTLLWSSVNSVNKQLLSFLRCQIIEFTSITGVVGCIASSPIIPISGWTKINLGIFLIVVYQLGFPWTGKLTMFVS